MIAFHSAVGRYLFPLGRERVRRHRVRARGEMMTPRPPLPPFTEASARQKVQAAEDAWNTRDPERVAGAYTQARRLCLLARYR